MFNPNWVPKNPKPVIITEIKETRNSEFKNVRLEQEFDGNDIVNPAQAIGMMLAGASTVQQRRPKVLYQSMSGAFLTSNGLVVGSRLPEHLFPGAYLARHDFQEGDPIPDELRGYSDYRGLAVYAPRTWENADGSMGIQKPKQAGLDGPVLMKNGKPIFIQTVLTLSGFCQANKAIYQDNVIPRGSNSSAVRERQGLPAANIQSIGRMDLGLGEGVGQGGSQIDERIKESYNTNEIPSFESEQTIDHTTTSLNATTPEGKANREALQEANKDKVTGGPVQQVATSQADFAGNNPESAAYGKNQAVPGGKGTAADPEMKGREDETGADQKKTTKKEKEAAEA